MFSCESSVGQIFVTTEYRNKPTSQFPDVTSEHTFPLDPTGGTLGWDSVRERSPGQSIPVPEDNLRGMEPLWTEVSLESPEWTYRWIFDPPSSRPGTRGKGTTKHNLAVEVQVPRKSSSRIYEVETGPETPITHTHWEHVPTPVKKTQRPTTKGGHTGHGWWECLWRSSLQVE